MKKILLITFCISLITPLSAWAQTAPQPTPDKHPSIEMMKKHQADLATKLNLSDEQKSAADQIRQQGRKKIKPLIEQKKQIEKEMNQIRKQNMEEFTKILTPEQKKVFDQIIKHKNKKHHHPKFLHQ